MNKEYIGIKLKNIRIERKMSIEQVATKIDININLLTKYEKGIYRPSYYHLTKLSELYNYPINKFLYDY